MSRLCALATVAFLCWTLSYGGSEPVQSGSTQERPSGVDDDLADLKTVSGLSPRYEDLQERRVNLLLDMFDIQAELKSLLVKLERAKNLEDQQVAFMRAVENSRRANQTDQLEFYTQQLEENTKTLKEHKNTLYHRDEIAAAQTRLGSHINELQELEARIEILVDPQVTAQKFKIQITWILAGMIGLVILGFFYIASVDTKVRRTIFGGDAGMQFLTLFSLVHRHHPLRDHRHSGW